MSLFAPSRDQARRFFIEAWRKQRERLPAQPLELLAADLVAMHPEYHALFADADQALARDWTPDSGEMNPFLHLSLHLAIAEQLSIDQPPGLRAAFEALRARCADEHEALHGVLDCLGETIWRAQREGGPPDTAAYLECVQRKTR